MNIRIFRVTYIYASERKYSNYLKIVKYNQINNVYDIIKETNRTS